VQASFFIGSTASYIRTRRPWLELDCFFPLFDRVIVLTREIEHDDANFPSSGHNRESSQRSVLLEAAGTGKALRFGLAAGEQSCVRHP
jgi:hypothetical protein